MKVFVFFILYTLLNSIFLSNADVCSCQCCAPTPENEDCQPEPIGNVTVSACSISPGTCEQRCRDQFQIPCNQINSQVIPVCYSDASSTDRPIVTTPENGPVQCKCSCCASAGCNPTHQGNVDADRCDQCPQKCGERYPSQCAAAIIDAIVCTHNHSSYMNYNSFLLILVFLKMFFH